MADRTQLKNYARLKEVTHDYKEFCTTAKSCAQTANPYPKECGWRGAEAHYDPESYSRSSFPRNDRWRQIFWAWRAAPVGDGASPVSTFAGRGD